MSRHAQDTDGAGGLTVEFEVSFETSGRAKRMVHAGDADAEVPPEPESPRRHSAAEMLGLAHYFERLVRSGGVADYAELARRTGFTRARITQVMNLLLLPPDIQGELLGEAGPHSLVTERALRSILKCETWEAAQATWGNTL